MSTATRAWAPNFDRYKKTLGWNGAINVRQFAIPVERFRWFAEYRYPDVAYSDRMTFRVGGLSFELHHGRGETDDATWTWIPERKIVAPATCSSGQRRTPATRRRCSATAANGHPPCARWRRWARRRCCPATACRSSAPTACARRFTDTADLLDSLEAQTLALMNQGATLDRVLHEVTMPEHLLAKPYLRPIYDHPQFILRNIWRLYGGWYDGEPDNLLPAPRAEQAREWVALAGGVEAVLKRIEALEAAGNLRLACHLVEFATIAAPSQETHAVRARVYAARSKAETSSMSRNILNHAALASAQGKRDLAGDYEPAGAN